MENTKISLFLFRVFALSCFRDKMILIIFYSVKDQM